MPPTLIECASTPTTGVPGLIIGPDYDFIKFVDASPAYPILLVNTTYTARYDTIIPGASPAAACTASFASANGGAFAIAAASDYRGEITTGAGWTSITKEITSSPEINAVGEHLTIPAPPIPPKPPAIYSGIYWIHPGKRNDTLYYAIYYVNYVYSPTVYTQV